MKKQQILKIKKKKVYGNIFFSNGVQNELDRINNLDEIGLSTISNQTRFLY